MNLNLNRNINIKKKLKKLTINYIIYKTKMT